MPPRAEILAQLSRLLEDDDLPSADDQAVKAAIDTRFWALAEGLLGEAAVSDDVTGKTSAEAYLQARVEFLAAMLSPEQRLRLLDTLTAGVAAW